MRLLRLLLPLALLAAVLATGAAVSAQPDRKLVTIKYATSFGTFGRDAYVYVAIEKGFFRDADLDVQVVPGQGTGNSRLLASGTVDYAAGDVTGGAIQRANAGFPVKVVALMSQISQSALVVLASSSIQTPKDLEGHTIVDTPASVNQILFPYYAKKAGINASKVTFINSTPPAIPALLASGRVDAAGQFTVGVPLLQKAAGGVPIRVFRYSRYLPGLLGPALWTTEDRISSDPDQVKRFTQALLKGLRWALDNPGAAGYIMQKYVPLSDPIVNAKELRILKPFDENACTRKNGLGYIDVAKMKATASLVNNAFHPSRTIRFDELYSTGFVKAASCKLPMKK